MIYDSIPLSGARRTFLAHSASVGVQLRKLYDEELRQKSMLIGEFRITEVELQVDTTDHSASNRNVNKIRK